MPLTAPRLWIVATPLGNPGDLSPRARAVLTAADLVLAEDTRRTARLFRDCGIEARRLLSFHDHNEAERQEHVLRALREGQNVALVSDAGTPLLADPGYRLVRACRKEGIHTCLDTNGFVRRYDPVIDELLEVTDLVMLDLKQMNDEIHQNLVGVSNHRTLEFAKYIADKGIKTWIRYVVVPGWSDDDDSAHRLGEFTRDMGNVEKIELLPYHELGKHKWVAMGEEYKLDGVKPPKKETMERVKGILEQYGHKVMY